MRTLNVEAGSNAPLRMHITFVLFVTFVVNNVEAAL
jgi:hypothetical protein